MNSLSDENETSSHLPLEARLVDVDLEYDAEAPHHSERSDDESVKCRETERTSHHASACTSQIEEKSNESVANQFLALCQEFFGEDVDLDKQWVELGLSSLKSYEFMNSVKARFLVSLPPNFEDLYESPNELLSYAIQSSGERFLLIPESYDIKEDNCKWDITLSKLTLSLIQALGIFVIFFVLALSFVPPFFIGKVTASLSVEFQVGTSSATWNWLPLIIPMFFFAFSASVLLLKWIIIGRYQPQKIQVQSFGYFRWWFIDRLVWLWEFLVGRYFLETKIISVFYQLLGAKISYSADIKSFIREFDLVTVGPQSSIEHPIRCRKFTPWADATSGPSMIFRPIEIGSGCSVMGMASPGVRLGDGARIERLAAVEEGSNIPESILAKGVPAYSAGTIESKDIEGSNWGLEVIKVMWLIAELYLHFALFLVFDVIIGVRLPAQWRYAPLMYWILLLFTVSVLSMAMSIVLKWTLIGRNTMERRQAPKTLWLKAADWICDTHYQVASSMLLTFFNASKVWVLIVKLHGGTIDFMSTVNNYAILKPSIVDFIVIQGSFVSTASLDFEECNGPIEIINSSVGYGARVYSGAKVIHSVVPPRTALTKSLYNSDEDKEQQPSMTATRVFYLFLIEVMVMLLALLTLISFIPAYEVFVGIVYGSPLGPALLGIVAALVTQGVTLNLLTWLVQGLALNMQEPVKSIMAIVYLTHCYHNRVWNFSQLLDGTAMKGSWLQWMGANVDGDLLMIDSTLHDVPLLSFGNRCVVDGSHIAGHFFVSNKFVWGPARLESDSLVHPGCYANAGSVIAGGEQQGPWNVFLGKLDEGVSDAPSAEGTAPPTPSEQEFSA